MISVVLPCFNAGSTLAACVDSLLRQTWQDFEIVAVNDGSEDDTAAMLECFAGQDSRVRVFHLDHVGVARAMHFGLEQCRGDYVARMDSDDLCRSCRLEVQKAHLDAHPHIGLVGGLVCFGGDPQRAKGYKSYVDWTNTLVCEREIWLSRFVESPFAYPSVMFRRAIIRQHGGIFDGPFPEDYECLLRWMEAGVRMDKVPCEVLLWNDPPSRLTRTDTRYSVDAFYRVKAQYLGRWLLQEGIRQVVVAGAGRVTRRRALLLEEHGVEISGWLDLDPRKIGKLANGKPVLPWNEQTVCGADFLVSFVGNRGARQRIAQELRQWGLAEGRRFVFAA